MKITFNLCSHGHSGIAFASKCGTIKGSTGTRSLGRWGLRSEEIVVLGNRIKAKVTHKGRKTVIRKATDNSLLGEIIQWRSSGELIRIGLDQEEMILKRCRNSQAGKCQAFSFRSDRNLCQVEILPAYEKDIIVIAGLIPKLARWYD